MALIKCPECGKEISDRSKVCVHCGFKFRKKLKKEHKKLSVAKKILIVFIVIIVLALLWTGGYTVYKNYYVPMSKYKAAEALLADNKFDDAISAFEKLGDFKDSGTRVLECHYKKAESLFESQSYEKAAIEYEFAGEYEDATAKVKEAKYEYAGKADLDDAIEIYKELGNYKDSKDKLKEAKEKKNYYAALKKLQAAYKQCKNYRTILSDDNRSIVVDSDDQYDHASIQDIVTIIEWLDSPDSLYEEMFSTNSLMGRQTKTYGYYEVTWSFHPDNGLDVVFQFVD